MNSEVDDCNTQWQFATKVTFHHENRYVIHDCFKEGA